MNTTPASDAVPPTITVSAAPRMLWPPNGKVVPVVATGVVSDAGSGVDPSTVTFSVRDSYGLVQPSGSVVTVFGGSGEEPMFRSQSCQPKLAVV